MVRISPWPLESATARRLIYLSVLLAVTGPLIWRISFREHASPMTRDVFMAIEDLPERARVLLVFDYDPPAEAEIKPMAAAFTRHLCQRQARLYCLTLWPTGPVEIDKVLRNVLTLEFPEFRYGVDHINLGYLSGGEGVIAVAATDFRKAFSTDVHNLSTYDTDRLPIMKGVQTIQDFDLIVDCSAGYPGLREWIQYAAVPANVPIVGGSVAVGSPEIYPYVPGQCVGLLSGLKGAAEYEQLLLENYPDFDRPECRVALQRMGPQTVAHILIIVLILLGNLSHLRQERKRDS